MHTSTRFPGPAKWICAAAFIVGLFAEGCVSVGTREAELKWWVLAGFVFFTIAFLLAGRMEAGALALGNILRHVADRTVPPLKRPVSRFFGYVGPFFVSLGLGMVTSALWRGAYCFWQGLVLVSSGVGMIVGRNLALNLLNSERRNRG